MTLTRSAATSAIMSVALLDPDAVWMLLYDVVSASTIAPGTCTVVSPKNQTLTQGENHQRTECSLTSLPVHLPTWKPIRSGTGSGGTSRIESGAYAPGQWPVTSALASDCCEVARQLLEAVEALEVPWHKATPVIAPDWQETNDEATTF